MGGRMSETLGPLLLYVEDEPLILELGVAAMEEAGFRVEALPTASAAFAALDARGAEFKALITDIDLGTASTGWDVARQARGQFPEMPVIYVSGGSSNDWPSLGVPGSIMLVKPYAAAQLVVAISNAMLRPEAGAPT
jgi:DNA-binding response OmpR family regulator